MSEATRQRIIQAAAEVFAGKGYRDAFTRDIARTAGLSEALVFKYFATKQTLYAAACAYLQEVQRDVVAEIDLTAPGQWLRRFALAVVAPDERRHDSKLAWAVRQGLLLQIERCVAPELPRHDLEGLLRPVIERGQALGQVRADIEPEVLVGVYWRFIVGCVLSQVVFPQSIPETWVEGFMVQMSG
ncbi:MAG: TetR/AcrR family transcriptional regulator [Propionibacteriaceae bacterium]|jgi:AcrR family transcriptional regulator|nr:TetR/AcrR family transcriptional regulator [Propionibacteriaceae bacterium]